MAGKAEMREMAVSDPEKYAKVMKNKVQQQKNKVSQGWNCVKMVAGNHLVN